MATFFSNSGGRETSDQKVHLASAGFEMSTTLPNEGSESCSEENLGHKQTEVTCIFDICTL